VTTSAPALSELERLARGQHADPHRLLGYHDRGVRALRPGATAMRILLDDGETLPMRHVHPTGIFEGGPVEEGQGYRLEADYGTPPSTFAFDDPYRAWPTLGEIDLHLIGEGRHRRLWEVLGAHHRIHDGVTGTAFAVWAPNARAVRVVGDWNFWDGRVHPMRSLGAAGVWELFIPGVAPGARYKYELISADNRLLLKADPLAFAAEKPPGTASVVAADSTHEWRDGGWLRRRAGADPYTRPHSVYEVHLGSWRPGLSYRELAEQLPPYVTDLGFTHVEFLPVAEHPFGGSWGYQVSAYYAPTARYGSPDDFRELVDACHDAGLGVIVDWVPAHFPRDEFALARFDGSALYEHADPRKGEHPDWGTLVFNFGRNEVRNFLIANALYWFDQFHVDGLRVDAVASMLYLDYSRRHGEWIPNQFGGRENLEAISFLKECNELVHAAHPGALMVAEESTAWPGVSRPTYVGGLGFGFKWNMGWMHDTLGYFARDPIYRRYHHNELTFGLVYAWSEQFVLPLSHDEVVHGKGSLFGKMPGDRWQRLANLRALFGWMWAHPGKQLLFMGGEFGQEHEWSHESSIEWHLLDDASHRGVSDLIRAINEVYRTQPALWQRDFTPDGFRWIDATDTDQSVLSFLRLSAEGQPVACVANLTPVPHHGYRIGLPAGGRWLELLNTDAVEFGGSGLGNTGAVDAEEHAWHGLDYSASLTLPPLAVLWLAPEG
jgi:1,4-alpha-glucan branching enzyme